MTLTTMSTSNMAGAAACSAILGSSLFSVDIVQRGLVYNGHRASLCCSAALYAGGEDQLRGRLDRLERASWHPLLSPLLLRRCVKCRR